MIQISNLAAQTVMPGQALIFNNIVVKTCSKSECFNKTLPATVKMCARGIYDITFNGNITGSAAGAALQLSLAIEGQPIVNTTMNATVAAAGDLANVSTETLIKNCCCDANRVSVINTGTTPVVVAPNSSLIVKRLS